LEINLHENVIVETARGIEFGQVVVPNTEVSEEEIVAPLKKVIRVATEEDKAHHEDNIRREKEAFDICLQKIANHKLEMKLVGVEYTFDNNKILFYFTADGRVDFRELVKDLASVFRTRIELRQIGVRDEAKMMEAWEFAAGSLLQLVPWRISAGIHKDGKRTGLSLNPPNIRCLRKAYVLSEI